MAVIAWLSLVALIPSPPSSPSHPGSSVTRLVGLKVVPTSCSHRVGWRAMGEKTRRWLVLNILIALINQILWLSISEKNCNFI